MKTISKTEVRRVTVSRNKDRVIIKETTSYRPMVYSNRKIDPSSVTLTVEELRLILAEVESQEARLPKP